MSVPPAPWSVDRRLSRTSRYALAVVGVALMSVVRWVLDPYLPPGRWYMLYFPMIALAARFGAGPALLSTVLSAMVVLFLFVEPRFTLAVRGGPDMFVLVLHLLGGAAVAAIGQSARTATWRAQTNAAESESRRRQLEAEITRREWAQAESQRARERFREAQDRSLYGYAILESVRDGSGTVVDFRWAYANPAAAALLGVPAGELIGHRLLQQLPTGHRLAAFFGRYVGVVETGLPFDAEVEYGTGDSGTGWVRNMAVRHDDGVAVSLIDVSDRKRLEQALRLGEERFAVALKHSPITVSNCDAQLRYTWVHNPLGGFQVEQLLGHTDAELAPDGALAELTALKQQVLSSGRGARRPIEFRPGDRTLHFDVTAEPLRDPEGAVVGLTVAAMEVTELVEAEQRARERADEVEALMQVMPIAVLRTDDPDCRVIQGNRSAYELMRSRAGTNLVRDGMEATPHRVVRAGRDLPTAELPLQVAAQGVEVRDEELDIRFEDGTLRTIFGHARPLFDDQGRPRGAVSAYLDVTELKRVREELRREHQRTLAILESIADSFYSLDHEGRFTYVNAQAERYLGRPKEALLGRLYWEEFPQTRGSPHEVAYRDAARSGRPAHLEFPSTIQVGRWIELHAYPAPEGLSVYIRDVTERKHTEQRVLQLNADLRHRVEELETLLDVVPIGLVLADDPACQQLRVNPAFATLLGLPVDGGATLTHLPAGYLARRVRRDGRPLADAELPIQRSVTLGHPVREELELEVADGQVYQLLVHSAPLTGEDGAVRGAIAAMIDLTERRRLESQLRARAEELQELDRRKTEFLAMLGHELRNPLAAVQVAVETLRQPGAAGDPQAIADRDWARDAIGRQVDHLGRLVDDLLDAARVARGEIQLRPEPTDLATIVARAVETTQPVLGACHHHLRVDLDPALGPITADPARLEQVLVNLLTNAAKYSEPGGQITLSAHPGPEASTDGAAAGTIEIAVRDTGIGIAPERLPQVFEMFTQLDPGLARSRGGLGIGLALVKTVVELHGGTISAQSDGLGHGSTFTVRLPRTGPASHAPAARPANGDGTGASTSLATATTTPPAVAAARPQPAGHRLRILVVDDNEDSARGLGRLLRRAGHEIALAHDGAAALEVATGFLPDAVLLDIGLPGLDGYEVARRLRTMPGPDRARLIAVSGYGQESDRQRSRAAGFDAHLVKPVDLAALRSLLATIPSAAPA